MLEALPKRTHEWTPKGVITIGWGEKRNPQQEEELRKALAERRAAGMTLRDACRELRTTARTANKLVGRWPRR